MLTDPHFAAREAIVRVAGPDVRRRWRCRTSSPSCPPRPAAVRWTGPALGPAQRRGLRRPARPLRRRARRARGPRCHLMDLRRRLRRGRVPRPDRLRRPPGGRRGRRGAGLPRARVPLTDAARSLRGARGPARPGWSARPAPPATRSSSPACRLAGRRRRRRLVRGQGARARASSRRARRWPTFPDDPAPAAGRGRGHQAVRLGVLRHQPRLHAQRLRTSTPCVRRRLLDQRLRPRHGARRPPARLPADRRRRRVRRPGRGHARPEPLRPRRQVRRRARREADALTTHLRSNPMTGPTRSTCPPSTSTAPTSRGIEPRHRRLRPAGPAGRCCTPTPSASTRTVMVQFPDGWRRDAVGHQPAGEEMVILVGRADDQRRTPPASVSYLRRRAAGDPLGHLGRRRHAARWCGSPAPAAAGPTATGRRRRRLDHGVAPGRRPRLDARRPGRHARSVSVHDDLAEQAFDTDVDVLWTDRAGAGRTSRPASRSRRSPGPAVVRHWA